MWYVYAICIPVVCLCLIFVWGFDHIDIRAVSVHIRIH